jgi:diguanylate cyclase (GGDEF)-like protein
MRRRDYVAAIELGRQSIETLRDVDDFALLAAAKANLGFALLATRQTETGKRLADEALADWRRSQSTSGVTWLLGMYSQYLAAAGDFKAALAMSEQQRDWLLRYEAERHQQEIELLSRDKALQAAELQNRRLQQGIAWGISLVLASFLVLAAILYRKLQTINRLETERNQQLNVQSTRDPLTMLYNRRYFETLMEAGGVAQERRRSGDEELVHAFLQIDLDHFKEINDRHGHSTGDFVLVEIARRLQSALRDSDVCVRWGGEEFLIFVPATNAENLKNLALRIMRTIGSDVVASPGSSIRVTASIGYVPMPIPPNGVMLPWKRAIDLADQACYMAKDHGRNCAFGIKHFNASDAEALAAIERDLDGAWKLGIVEMESLAGAVDASKRGVAPDAQTTNDVGSN